MNAGLRDAICAAITEATGQEFAGCAALAAAGGSIHRCYVLDGGSRRYFAKTNAAAMLPQFAAEADGLMRLARTRCVGVPNVICQGATADASYLALEYLELKPATAEGQAKLGSAIAALHRAEPGSVLFGLGSDNFIGSSPQVNAPCGDWVEFFRERRLRVQLEAAGRHGFGEALAPCSRLLPRIGLAFSGYRPQPSLVHGDLWSGNAGELPSGAPVIFDPAVYIGDRETDLAMTELFGGFSAEFYAAYDAAWPRDPGYAVRCGLYQLYHVLNHLNLFGAGYLPQVRALVAKLDAGLSRAAG